MSAQRLSFLVSGAPETQGSTRAFIPKGWTRAVITTDNARLKPWRSMVQASALDAQDRQGSWPVVSESAIRVDVTFGLLRPPSVSPRRRPHPSVKPDIDKLARAILDSLTKVLWRDDAQVVELHTRKVYLAPTQPAHTLVVVQELAAPSLGPAVTTTTGTLFPPQEETRV